MQAGAGTAARLSANTTLVSPSLVVPRGAQTLSIRARAPRAGADAEISARPDDGSADVPLGVIAPGGAFREHAVGLANLQGRAVRIVIDPVPALGRALDVARVGPLIAPLPGWRLLAGRPERSGRLLLVREDPLALASSAFRPRRGSRAVLISLRGDGLLTASAGGRAVRARARPLWRTVRVPVPVGARRVTVQLRADPRGGEMRLRRLGVAPAPVRP